VSRETIALAFVQGPKTRRVVAALPEMVEATPTTPRSFVGRGKGGGTERERSMRMNVRKTKGQNAIQERIVTLPLAHQE
jgi:hypothetical protein